MQERGYVENVSFAIEEQIENKQEFILPDTNAFGRAFRLHDFFFIIQALM